MGKLYNLFEPQLHSYVCDCCEGEFQRRSHHEQDESPWMCLACEDFADLNCAGCDARFLAMNKPTSEELNFCGAW